VTEKPRGAQPVAVNETIVRRGLSGALVALLALSACSEADDPEGGTGGATTGGATTGGTAPGGSATGGALGGTTASGGTSGSATAGAATGGSAAGGASPSGGSAGTGTTGGESGAPPTGGTGGVAGAGATGGAGAGGAGLGGTGGSASGAGGSGSGGSGGKAGSGAGGESGKGGTGGGGATANITVWIAGDSTVATGSSACPYGWGGVFDPLFNDRVTVTNSAVGGRSVRTWLYNVGTTMDSTGECTLARDASGNPTIQARWQAMLTGMKSGDYLFIQFGINDSSATCDRHVGLAAFKESYGMMAKAAKDRGAQPIFVTPVSSVACNGTTARGTRGSFVTATQEAGTQYGVPVIDLHALSVALYQSRGFCPVPGGDVSASTGGPVGEFFCDDHTHFDRPGATAIAGLVAQALRTQSIPLAAYLR
jgi:lysophospholipase L1-like esterase